MARPKGTLKFVLSDKQIEELETMAGLGIPMESIAAIFGMSKDTLEARVKDQAGVKSAIERGKGKVRATIYQTAYNQAMSGNTAMLIFWLKTREGWKETDRLELTGADGKPLEVTALTYEQRQRRIKELSKVLAEPDET